MFFSTNNPSANKDSDKKEEVEAKVKYENQVVIYVWKPKVDGQDATAKKVLNEISNARAQGRRANVNIGHVTLAIPQTYASIWPAESAGGNQFKVVKAAYVDSFKEDIDNEGREPDTIITLYSLNIKAIESSLREIKCSDAGFALSGDNSSTRSSNDKQAYNCNGLVYALLQAGGVDAITPFGAESRFVFYISPDKFDSYIKEVKEKELEKYPETANYQKNEKEYSPPKKKKMCVIQ